jgi:hypothetical protein
MAAAGPREATREIISREPLLATYASDRLGFDVERGRAAFDPLDAYCSALLIALAGYAILGKGFAYLGLPPLFIGEVMLALGLAAIYRSRCGLAIFTTLPSILLVITMAVVGWRALTCFGTYGIDAIRDSMILLYGFYAFIVIALVLQKPERLSRTLKAFGSFAWLYAIIGGSLAYLSSTLADFVPNWPLLDVPMLHTRQGESAVHLTGAAVFALLGLRKFKTPWVIMLFFSIILVTPSRGAMLSCFIPIGLALVLSGRMRRLAPVLLCAAAFLSFTYVADIKIPLPGGRSIGSEQLVENVTSIVAKSDTSNLDGTKEWRLRWWNTIEDYTFNGPFFWSGKGFGMGLAEEDGFVVGTETGGPALRSPHNAHYTMLARVGVPGLLLWAVLNVAWYTMIFGQWFVARRNGHDQWASVFLWVGCYELSAIIDATFDVALEGPMLGIFFWSLFGFGIAAVMIYRYQLRGVRSGSLRGVLGPFALGQLPSTTAIPQHAAIPR